MLYRTGDSLQSVLIGSERSDSCVEMLIDVIYSRWGIQFDPDQNEILGVLPHTVLSRKKGSCLGVSRLFLMLAERAGCPLKGVVLPGHFLVRYETDSAARNIEPNLNGCRHPDAYYRSRYGVVEGSWYDMRRLTSEQTAGVLYFNLGNILMMQDKTAYAVECFRRSVARFGGYAEAWGNLAIALEREGQSDSARSAFQRARALRPSLENLALNRGSFELKHGNFAAARDAFRAGIEHFPNEPELYYGLALAYHGLRMNDSARAASAVLARRFPGFERCAKLHKIIY
jgi:regulator of sirC expression with transglutaminase-like and TPR domain